MRLASKIIRTRASLFLVVIFAFCLSPFTVNSTGISQSTARAEDVPDPLEVDFEKLEEMLEAHPEALDNQPEYETWSAGNYQEISRALAYIETVDADYSGSTISSFTSGFQDVLGDPTIEADYTALQDGFASVAEGGATESAIAAEALDTAIGGGVLALPALIPAAAYLGYEDITTGSNPITIALFGANETYEQFRAEETGAEEDVAAESLAWVSFPAIHSGGNLGSEVSVYEDEHATCDETGGPYVTFTPFFVEHCSASKAHDRFGNPETAEKHKRAYNGAEEFPTYISGPVFFLEPEVGGHYYLGSEQSQDGCQGECTFSGGSSSVKSFMTGWITRNQQCAVLGGGSAGIPSIAGFPSGPVGKSGVPGGGAEFDIFGATQNQFCTVKGRYNHSVVAEARQVSKLKSGMPRKGTELGVAEKEAGGHPITHVGSACIGCPGGISVKDGARGIHDRLREKQDPGITKATKHWFEEVVPPGRPAEPPTTPLPGTAIVPGCGTTGTACKAELESAGFTNIEIDPRTWENAVVTKPANAVVFISPASGSKVETSTKIKVETNPAEMPLIVPDFAFGTDTYTSYVSKLEKAGFTDTDEVVRTEVDEAVGPERVTEVAPHPGTRVDPADGGSTKVDVTVNPPTAPPIAPGTGVGPPTLPGFKLPNLGVFCKGFPFGVPCWLWKTIESWSSTGVAPEWGLEGIEIDGHKITTLKFKLSKLEPIMEKVRPAIIVFATIGLVLLFYGFAKGGGPPSGGRGDTGGGSDTPTPDEGVYL